MSKRKNSIDMDVSDNEDTNSINEQMIDVNFEFFDPKEVDYPTIKNFLNVLYGVNGSVDTGDLTDLIVGQPLIGTTIKTAVDEDAYCIFTILNMNVHASRPSIGQLRDLLLSGTAANPELSDLLGRLLAPDSQHHLGYLVNERIVNMPVQTAPPMYRMLQEEIQWALEDKEPYDFEYFFILSKTYKEAPNAPDLDDAPNRGEGGKKKRNEPDTVEFYFNAEDELLIPVADYVHTIKFSNRGVPESKRAFNEFGIVEGRKLLVFHKSKYPQLLSVLENGIPQA